jgi:Transglycosylase SLT domain.
MATNQLTDQQIANVAVASGWTGQDVVIATAVALAESGGDSLQQHHNLDGSTDYGLWQVNSVHGFDPKDLLEVIDNGKAAHEVWSKQGWEAWTTFKTGAYLLYMSRAKAVTPSVGPGGTVEGHSATESVNVLSGLLDFVSAGADWLSNAHNWVRIAQSLVGGVLIITGLAIMSKPVLQSQPVKTAASLAMTKGLA